MMRNMFAKHFGRGTRDFSTISTSSSSSSIMKRVWDEQKTSWLVMAFIGGFLGHGLINAQKRKVRVQKVERMYDEYEKRKEEWSRSLS